MLSRGVCLLHNNVQPHSAHITTALLEKFKWDILDHPPYSPDLVPSDFHLFLHLKKHLARKTFCDSGIKKLVPRLNKCLDSAGDYVEK
jgi:transposase